MGNQQFMIDLNKKMVLFLIAAVDFDTPRIHLEVQR